MANKNQGNRNRLMRVDYAKQTPKRLFQDWDRDQYDIFVEINRTPQNKVEGNNSLQSRCNPKLLFITSPTVRKITPMPPNAPIKFKKHFSKKGLKPKKLRFTDKEGEEVENRNHVQKTTDCAIKIFNHKSSVKQRVESKGELSKENLNAMLQDIRLGTDNKENRPCGKEQYERKVKNNHRSVSTSSSKNIDNSAQSSKLSYKLKGEFLHFRI